MNFKPFIVILGGIFGFQTFQSGPVHIPDDLATCGNDRRESFKHDI